MKPIAVSWFDQSDGSNESDMYPVRHHYKDDGVSSAIYFSPSPVTNKYVVTVLDTGLYIIVSIDTFHLAIHLALFQHISHVTSSGNCITLSRDGEEQVVLSVPEEKVVKLTQFLRKNIVELRYDVICYLCLPAFQIAVSWKKLPNGNCYRVTDHMLNSNITYR